MSRSSRLHLAAVVSRLAFVVLAATAAPALAATWVVNPTGVGDDFPNIQSAIASTAVLPGDTILLKNGVYTGLGNRDIDFMGKDVVVRSMSMDPNLCIIDCQGSPSAPHRGFLLYQGETNAAWIQAIKIAYGRTLYSPGAAIYIDGAAPIIDNCIIEYCIVQGNTAWGPGGGIYSGGAQVAYSDIWGNSTVYGNGGGVFLNGAGMIFCNVQGNSGVGGGGVYAVNASIGRCLIAGNASPGDGGGGLMAYGSNVQATTISGNRAYAGGGVTGTNSAFDRVIVWGNCADLQGNEIDGDASLSFVCCCVNPAGVNGSLNYQGNQIFSNPQFCAPASCNSAPTTGGNYALTSASPCLPGNSPCGNLIGSLPQGCQAADVAEFAGATISLELPGVARGSAEIAWSLDRSDRARLAVYDVQGRCLATLVDDSQAAAGEHRTRWDGRDGQGARLPRGVYFARLETSRETITRRTILLDR